MKPKENRLGISENELLEYINRVGEVIPERPAFFGITLDEYCMGQKPHIALSTGRRIMMRLVSAGKLKHQRMKQNGHIVTVYYK